jgi:hypothetical protein
MKTADVKKSLSNELVRIEEEMYKFDLSLGRDTLISKRPKTAEFNNKLLLSRGKRQPFNSNF